MKNIPSWQTSHPGIRQTSRPACPLPTDCTLYRPTVRITNRLYALPTNSTHYQTDSTHYIDRLCALPTDSTHYRPTLPLTDRLYALPTYSAYYRPTLRIIGRLCPLPTDSAPYRPTVRITDCTHYRLTLRIINTSRLYALPTDATHYQPTLCITNRLYAVPTDSTHYRPTLRITNRLYALPTDSTHYRPTHYRPAHYLQTVRFTNCQAKGGVLHPFPTHTPAHYAPDSTCPWPHAHRYLISMHMLHLYRNYQTIVQKFQQEKGKKHNQI